MLPICEGLSTREWGQLQLAIPSKKYNVFFPIPTLPAATRCLQLFNYLYDLHVISPPI